MAGFAQQLFNQKNEKKPLGPRGFLKTLLESGWLSFIDFTLAERLLSDFPDAEESCAALLCHLSAAGRQGHLCVKIDEEGIYPDPIACWGDTTHEEESFESKQAMLREIPALIREGAKRIPAPLMTEICPEADRQNIGTPLCRSGNLYYLQRYWYYESYFLKQVRRYLACPPKIQLDINKVNDQVRGLEKERILLPEQADAIANACQNSLTIICGGPGTGKTYTAGHLIRILWESLSEAQKRSFQIALAAPTGKAAANLHKSLQKACANIQALRALQARTLHNLLGIRSSSKLPKNEMPSIAADLVIVDECSMIDVRLMGYLFAAMKPGSRLVMLGDNHQLPAVEAGGLFADLIRSSFAASSKVVNPLQACMRAELKEILDFASAVNQGDTARTFQLLDNSGGHGVHRLKVNDKDCSPRELQEIICAYAMPHYKTETADIAHFNKFRILSPLRKGYLGVEEINRILLRELKKSTSSAPFVAPIILLKNDYRLDLFNGETGILVIKPRSYAEREFELIQGDYALFPSRDGEGVRRVPALLLPPYEYAFCLSVHKSQGSEFDHVVLLLPSGSENFGREVLYTAVTRARRQLEVYAEDAVMAETIRRRNHRLSGIV